MKKVFALFYLSLSFLVIGLVLLVDSSNAQPPFPGGLPSCQANLNTCTTDLTMCNDDLAACEAQPAAPVAQTGQTTCWDSSGMSIDCPGTGQDGDVQAGVEWPVPRFTDNMNGTITDNLTGLIWLRNMGCLVPVTWAGALTAASTLHHGDCGLTDSFMAGDWRLPNRNELSSLLDFENLFLGLVPPFTNPNSSYYWTSTTWFAEEEAWVVRFNGEVDHWLKTDNLWLVLPVRGGL